MWVMVSFLDILILNSTAAVRVPEGLLPSDPKGLMVVAVPRSVSVVQTECVAVNRKVINSMA